MSMHDFEIINKLGEGAYSSVYKVRRFIDNAIYAIKKVKLRNLSAREIHNSVNEVRILASIRHPNIVCYKEAFYDPTSKSLCIVMEYADGGDLMQKIMEHKRRGVMFSEKYIWEVFTQVVKGLMALHELKILHRDIKSANVFLTKQGAAKLGDMNVSKVLRKESMCETQTGTPYYASPQVWNDQPYDSKSDIWSLGCVLYEFISLKPPFRARDMEGLYKKVTLGNYNRINKHYSEDLSSLLKQMINLDPKQRISCDKILEIPEVQKRMQAKPLEVEEQSILLKTIKLSKNINYLTERLPKPNYSPLKYKSAPKKASHLRAQSKSPLLLKSSLPPINSHFTLHKQDNRSLVQGNRISLIRDSILYGNRYRIKRDDNEQVIERGKYRRKGLNESPVGIQLGKDHSLPRISGYNNNKSLKVYLLP